MLSVIIAAAVILVDQLSKVLVLKYLAPVGNIPLIKGVLEFTYVKNGGAAFGILSENRYVFMVASVLIIALLGFIVYKFHGQSKLFDVCLGLILGGGIGNMIDRIRLEYVVDFIDFCAFDFWTWVFNVADSAVVVGCFLAIICLIMEQKTGKKLFEENKANNTQTENNGEDNNE